MSFVAPLTTSMVFAAVGVGFDVPPSVVTVTARGPTGASAATLKLTVMRVPSGVAAGAATVIPSPGTKLTACRSWKLRPVTVRVMPLVPVRASSGEIQSRIGIGRTILIRSASGRTGRIWLGAVRTTRRVVVGASAATVTGTVSWLPSGLAASAPRVTPSGGDRLTAVTEPRPTPAITSGWGPVPMVSTLGLTSARWLPTTTPAGPEVTA
jgi:hypothetical protein